MPTNRLLQLIQEAIIPDDDLADLAESIAKKVGINPPADDTDDAAMDIYSDQTAAIHYLLLQEYLANFTPEIAQLAQTLTESY